MKLYATRTGSRYHRYAECNGLNSYHTANGGWFADAPVPAVTRAEAVRRGLQPCKSCQPAPLLTVAPTPESA